MTIELPPSIEFGQVQGTFGEVLEAATQDRQSMMRVRRGDIRLMGEKLLAQQASPEIAIDASTKLSIYEKRVLTGSDHPEACLLLDLGAAGSLALTKKSAYHLACALLAYSSAENKRSDWLIRVESVES